MANVGRGVPHPECLEFRNELQGTGRNEDAEDNVRGSKRREYLAAQAVLECPRGTNNN
jgi:hypothetical protein